MTMGWRKWALAAAVLLVIVVVVLLREDEQRDTIRVVILKYLSYAPLFIAEEEGFFEAEGLEVELLPVTRVSDAIPTLVEGGGVDVLPAAIMPAYFNVINRGGLMKVVAGKGYVQPGGCAYSGIMVRRSLLDSGELSSAADLAGRRISMELIAPSYFRIDRFLKSNGLTMKDLKIVDIPLLARIDAFERGTLDVSTASEPWVTLFRRSGQASLFANTADFLPGFQYGYLLFGKTLLQDRREAGERFMLAYLKAVRHMNAEGKSDRHIEILSKYTGLDKGLLAEACWPSVRDDGRVQPESLDMFQRWELDQGLVSATTPMDLLYDPSFVEHANRVLAAQK